MMRVCVMWILLVSWQGSCSAWFLGLDAIPELFSGVFGSGKEAPNDTLDADEKVLFESLEDYSGEILSLGPEHDSWIDSNFTEYVGGESELNESYADFLKQYINIDEQRNEEEDSSGSGSGSGMEQAAGANDSILLQPIFDEDDAELMEVLRKKSSGVENGEIVDAQLELSTGGEDAIHTYIRDMLQSKWQKEKAESEDKVAGLDDLFGDEGSGALMMADSATHNHLEDSLEDELIVEGIRAEEVSSAAASPLGAFWLFIALHFAVNLIMQVICV